MSPEGAAGLMGGIRWVDGAGALGWPRGMGRGGRCEGGFRMGNTCTPVALVTFCHQGGVICISEVIDISGAILIPACASSSPAFLMMYSA